MQVLPSAKTVCHAATWHPSHHLGQTKGNLPQASATMQQLSLAGDRYHRSLSDSLPGLRFV
jgi:hypothetical protein